MARRVLLYAVIYGSVGVAIGVMLALYTADVDPTQKHKNIVIPNGNKNGSASKATTAAPEPTNKVEEIN